MSHVLLLAAERSFPTQRYPRQITLENGMKHVLTEGLTIETAHYYRAAAEGLGYSMKPCLYELDMEECAEDFLFLRAYLEEHLGCGESVELWSVWVGSGSGKLAKYRGSLNDFDLDAFTQLWERVPLLENGQTCLTITADPERSRNGKQSNRTDQ